MCSGEMAESGVAVDMICGPWPKMCSSNGIPFSRRVWASSRLCIELTIGSSAVCHMKQGGVFSDTLFSRDSSGFDSYV